MTESIAIIGAGVAGLATGCYARMNGYRTRIFELHDKPGGMCTSWERNGYTFDNCLQWLVGTAPGEGFHRLWLELGALRGREIVDHEELTRYERADGRALVLYTDPDRLVAHIKELSREDAGRADELRRAIQHFRGFQPMLDRPHGVKSLLEQMGALLDVAPAVPDLVRYRKTSVQDFAARFADPFLREAFAELFSLPDFPFVAMAGMFAFMANRDAGYPIGGSLPFARAIEQRYLGLGGQLSYQARVRRILVERDRAIGVELDNGERYAADLVISAADGHATLFDMLEGRYLDHELRERYGTLPRFPSLVRVSLGVARDLGPEPHSVSFPLREAIPIDGKPVRRMTLRHYAYDPTLAPAGKTALSVAFDSSYDAWRALAQDPQRYASEKERIARDVIAGIEQRLPGIARQVEAVDVATPLSYERYTGNWQGSIEGWLITTRTLGMRMPDSLPGLQQFHMVGQWTQPGGGVPPAAWSGRSVIRKLCERDGKRFETTSP